MRYRPFGGTGAAVSNLTLSLGSEALGRGRAALSELIFTALEAGVNSYHLENADPALAEIVGEALGHVERRLVCVGVTLGVGDGRRKGFRDFSAEGLTGSIDRALHASGLGWFDVAVLDEPADDELPQASLTALKALRKAGHVKLLGVSGDSPVMDVYVSTGAFDVLYTPFHVNVEWRIRSRMRAARERDMAIFTYDYYPESLSTERKAAGAGTPRKKGLFGFGAKPVEQGLANAGSFAFLHQTPNWNAESICLAFILTDPAIASVMVDAINPERMEALALVPERDLPPGLSAQIEMARVGSAVA
ncbi:MULTISPECIES: aldo/keto reductase [unclassified Brevundimonas]|uniref:aldo/keto reductase n=1 Tax=unclassified Brevundimonas TaxID=2622653 RepID=UPI000CFB8159|nr:MULTISPECIES: aldo/keto reductase [unclassified Brevundimonas]PRA36672.1 oxidoreductase [Brevundimonas sp. MYb27]PQZ79467.1 oxidoreductase [Brevundimonas sp. MYb31]PRB13012.1 oxidoreductase [Brevundimonas sp. MYb52]PRB33631.1 oxidoreductase [Brevundimonas sp. MYb46]PRB48922.1 oxidoreductase [Brevundimonas sp. MYb33]